MRVGNSSLVSLIETKIADKNGIPFSEYMSMALYYPELGYYMNSLPKFGKEGDFMTASTIGTLFATTLMHALLPVFEKENLDCFIELGGGNGDFAYAFLSQLPKVHPLKEYIIIEPSQYLQMQQKEKLKEIPLQKNLKITWLNEPHALHAQGVVFANEVFDALPVEIFCYQNQECLQGYVKNEQNAFQLDFSKPMPDLQKYFNEKILPLSSEWEPGYQSECCLILPSFAKKCAELLGRGLYLFFDYGYARAEYYHPERNRGTLTTFHKHQTHYEIFENIGQQDITASVDFTLLAENFIASECTLEGFTTFASFLMGAGLLTLLEGRALTREEKSEAVLLMMPYEMGDTIKAMGFSKNLQSSLNSWFLGDRSYSL